MGCTCDFCGEQRAMVYCRSDAACLCLSCDRNVHSTNALCRRHSRTLLCERCNSQPAFVRCAEEKISLCQNCDWMGHGTSTSASTHKRQAINCYSGCPSAAELSSIWRFVLDPPSAVESTCEQEMGLMSITENGAGSTREPPESANSQNPSGVVEPNTICQIAKSGAWARSPTMPEPNPVANSPSQLSGSANAALPKVLKRLKGVMASEKVKEHYDMDAEGKWVCKFCGHALAKGTSPTRLKFHLSGEGGRGVRICKKVPLQVKEAEYLSVDSNKRQKTMPPHRVDVGVVRCTIPSSSREQPSHFDNRGGMMLEPDSRQPVEEIVAPMLTQGDELLTANLVGEDFERYMNVVWPSLLDDDENWYLGDGWSGENSPAILTIEGE